MRGKRKFWSRRTKKKQDIGNPYMQFDPAESSGTNLEVSGAETAVTTRKRKRERVATFIGCYLTKRSPIPTLVDSVVEEKALLASLGSKILTLDPYILDYHGSHLESSFDLTLKPTEEPKIQSEDLYFQVLNFDEPRFGPYQETLPSPVPSPVSAAYSRKKERSELLRKIASNHDLKSLRSKRSAANEAESIASESSFSPGSSPKKLVNFSNLMKSVTSLFTIKSSTHRVGDSFVQSPLQSPSISMPEINAHEEDCQRSFRF